MAKAPVATIERVPKSNNYTIAALLIVALLSAVETSAVGVASPDDRIRVDVSLSDSGEPQYEVRYRGEVLIAASRLGMRFREHAAIEGCMRQLAVERQSTDSTWQQPWGERRLVRDHYNELQVRFASCDEPAREFRPSRSRARRRCRLALRSAAAGLLR